jgi:hypothetical protein
LRLFGADLTATQISEVARLERKTVNRIFQLLRARIAEFAEEESYFSDRVLSTNDCGINRSIWNAAKYGQIPTVEEMCCETAK